MKRLFPVLCLLICLLAAHSFAGSATWNLNPTSGDWNTAANWTPATVPDNVGAIATFAESNLYSLSISSNTKVANIVFAEDAGPFKISASPRHTLTLGGAGIVNNSTAIQKFLTQAVHSGGHGAILFNHNATVAGPVMFTNQGTSHHGAGGKTQFLDYANAGAATFLNEPARAYFGAGAGRTMFSGHSSAGYGTFTNLGDPRFFAPGYTFFGSNTTADHGTFISNGEVAGVYFHDFATAGDATIVNSNRARTVFSDHTSAGRSTIINNGEIGGVDQGPAYTLFYQIYSSPDAGEATLIANPGTNGGDGGFILLEAATTASSATIKVYGNGILSFNGHGPTAAIGSLEGDGLVFLYNVNLSIGGNDRDTTFSGVIDENNSGLLGTVTKVGQGTLIFSGANTYDGGTTITAGVLSVENQSGSATGTGGVNTNGGTLGGNGIIAGPVVVGTENGASAFFQPSAATNTPSTLTIQDMMTFKATGSYHYFVDTDNVQSDEVLANGMTIESSAQFQLISAGSASLPLGTVFTAIDNTSANPISGTFANLADGSTVTVGVNKLQANYSGGDGNDLTLTVVP